MISISYPKKRSKWQGHPPPVVTSVVPMHDAGLTTVAAIRASKLGISTEEWLRRDSLIKKLVLECPFRANDTFYPPNKKDFDYYGKCLVTGRVVAYNEIDHDKWPASDNPLILTCQTLDNTKKDRIFNCTTNYPNKHEPD